MAIWKRARDLVTSRWFVKGAFFLYFVYACVELMRFKAWTEGTGAYVRRPEVVAGLLPVGHFTSFFAWMRGGGWDTLLPAGLVIIIGGLTTSLLFKRGFCGYICPVGTVWEGFSAAGRRILGGRHLRVPKWLDIAGRGFRYVLTAAIVTLLFLVPLSEAVAFRRLPYMWLADVKILSIMLAPAYLGVVGVAGVLSMLFGPVWCRYLCPVGGLYSAVSLASVCTVVRDEELCTHCHRCSTTCHADVDVETKRTVRDPECDGCMDCVNVCPADGCLSAKAPGGLRIASWVWPLLAVAVWLAIFGVAKVSGNWDTRVTPDQMRAAVQSGILEQSSMPQQ